MSAPLNPQKGSVLLESLIAILIFSFGILGIIGLQSASVKNTSEARYRTQASFLANEIISQMWGDRTNLDSYETPPVPWTDRVAKSLPDGKGTVVVDTDTNTTRPRVTVTVTWQLPGNDKHTFTSVAYLGTTCQTALCAE
jgi:type IV pilus assembly protein PilV